jgi:CDP-4-dehydro-6-deoxyglucose reductase, E1
VSDPARAAAIEALVRAQLAPELPREPAIGAFEGAGLPLVVPGFGLAEVAAAVTCLLDGRLTMGAQVEAFEAEWAAFVGTRHCVMLNSGSSALLVLLSALVHSGRLRRGEEVLVPAVGWSTGLFAVAQAGLRPVLVDVSPDTLCLEGRFDRPVLAVHLLGQPARVEAPLWIEDACGAHGAALDGRRVGSLGVGGCFSFFYSHHLTTGEGGAITLSDPELADVARSLRAHGWVRERSDRAALEAASPAADPRFLFVSAGYNLRPGDPMAAFGRVQIARLAAFVAQRRDNHRAWCREVAALGLPLRVFPEARGTRHAGFAFPLLLDADAPLDRRALCARLEAQGIETRPISGGNLARQPAFAAVPGARVEGPLPVADAVHERGLFVGQSQAFGPAQGAALCRALARAFGRDAPGPL